MGILSDIFHKIFPAGHPATQAPATPPGTPMPTPPGAPAAQTPAAAPVSPPPTVDVQQVLTDLAGKTPEKLNWQSSIVDLMKLLGLDSSLEHRKQLAAELHYSGDTNDSASMNIWLHQQVMQQLAANGGKVPAGLLG